MKKVFSTYYLHFLMALLPITLFMGSCSDIEEATSPQPTGTEKAVLSLSTQVAQVGTDIENDIHTIRIILFAEDGKSVIDNKLYVTTNATNGIPNATYTYFAKVGDEYRISELRSKISMQIMVIANELSSMNDVKTLEGARNTVVDFANKYADNNGNLNISIGTTQSSTNLGYIPMYVESGLLTHSEWDASNGKPVNLPLVRLLAKVTVKLQEGIRSQLKSDEKVEIQSASIINVPRQGNWYPQEPQIPDQISTATQNFSEASSSSPFVVDGSAPHAGNETNELTFYIPENIIRQTLYDNQRYTYVQINAQYTSGTTSPIKSIYKIPLGNGVHKLTGVTENDIKKLSREDLILSRNTWYKVYAGITTYGTLEIQEIQVKLNDWDGTPIEINGDMDIPLLNISTKDVKMSADMVDVHFWTNQAAPTIAEKCTIKKNGTTTEEEVNNVFEGLYGTNAPNFSLHEDGVNSDYYPYNGYIRLKLLNQSAYDEDATYTITMQAGKLSRTIEVTTNPQVGRFLFTLNGGTADDVALLEHTIWYKDLDFEPGKGGSKQAITSSHLSVTPPAVNAPSGKTFLAWVYETTEIAVDNDPSNGNNLLITPTGYTTRIKALWQ